MSINGMNTNALACLSIGLLTTWRSPKRTYLGYPKIPTALVYQLIDGKYRVQKFQRSDRIISPTFPQLELTKQQLVAASQIEKI